jgi:hypothetical protein
MPEVTVDGHRYRYEVPPLETQHEIVTCLAPVIGALGGAMAAYKDQDKDNLVAAIRPAMEAFATLKREDSKFVLGECLSRVQREIDGGRGWQQIWTKGSPSPMFADIRLAQMYELVVHVLSEFMLPFFSDLLSMLPRAGAQVGLNMNQFASPEEKTGS